MVPGVTESFRHTNDKMYLRNSGANFDERRYDPQAIRKHAEGFDTEVFKSKIRAYIKATRAEYDEHVAKI